MSFNNLLLAVALTVLWPLVLMGVLAAAEWLERRTLTAGEIVPRGLRPAEPAQAAMGGTAGADGGMAASWAGADRGSPAGTGGDTPAGSPGGTLGPEALGGGAADGERAAARRAVGGRGRHLRRAGGGRHERRG